MRRTGRPLGQSRSAAHGTLVPVPKDLREYAQDSCPRSPGVYLFRDAEGDARLRRQGQVAARARALSTSRRGATTGTGSIRGLAERVDDIEVIVTGSEVEALHLEQNLIKRHRPPFNVRLRDDKSFPYIAVTVEDDFPRVMFTRERHRRGVVYFGPYANAKKVRETLDVLNRVFRYRPCEGPQPGRHSGIPCLDYHIERCLAPCVGYVSKEDYRLIIDGSSSSSRERRGRSSASSSGRCKTPPTDERFEEAARYRNRLFAVRHLAERQAADKRAVGTVDVIGIAAEGDRAAVQVFPLRDGQLVDRYSFHLENVAGQDLGDAARGVLPRVLRLVAERPAADRRRPAGSGGHLRAGGVSLGAARLARRGARGRARREAAARRSSPQQNARARARVGCRPVRAAKRLRRVEALEELREALNLESLPIRIECFDISNIQGESPVGSMVVFQDAMPKKAHYRKFGVRGVERPGRLRVDGGGGHAPLRAPARRDGRGVRRVVRGDAEPRRRSTAERASSRRRWRRCRRYDLPRVAVISLAKREEEVFVPGRPEADRARPPLGRRSSCCSGSATRRTASRSASTASGGTRRRRSRSSTRSRVSARHDGAR